MPKYTIICKRMYIDLVGTDLKLESSSMTEIAVCYKIDKVPNIMYKKKFLTSRLGDVLEVITKKEKALLFKDDKDLGELAKLKVNHFPDSIPINCIKELIHLTKAGKELNDKWQDEIKIFNKKFDMFKKKV